MKSEREDENYGRFWVSWFVRENQRASSPTFDEEAFEKEYGPEIKNAFGRFKAGRLQSSQKALSQAQKAREFLQQNGIDPEKIIEAMAKPGRTEEY